MDVMRFPQLEHAMRMVRTYLVDCAENDVWHDLRTAELNEMIRSCVERIAVDRHGARPSPDALRHAIGYIDERRAPADRTWTKWRAFDDDSARARI